VLLPRDEDDEGIGAIISMYYCYNTTRNQDIIPIEAAGGDTGTSTDESDNDNKNIDNTLILDDSVTGYVLLHISSGKDETTNSTPTTATTAATNAGDVNTIRQSSHLIDEDFASILSIIRKHPKPIVLTFANLPVHESEDVIETVNDTSEKTPTTTTTARTSPLSNIDDEHVVEVPFEEEKKSEEGLTAVSCHKNNSNANTTSPPPPPPSDILDPNKDVTPSASLSPNTLLSTTTKQFSSWTSRMSVVAVVNTATALAKAANEQAKVVTSARMTNAAAAAAAAVVPEFNPTSTTTTTAATTTTTNVTNYSSRSSSNATTSPVKESNTSTPTVNYIVEQGKRSFNVPDQNLPALSTITSTTSQTTTAAAVAAAMTSAQNASTPTTSTLKEDHPNRILLPNLQIHVQSETGEFVPVPEKALSTIEQPKNLVSPTKLNQTAPSLITNSSYIMIRINAQQSIPSNTDYRYQWYRSCTRNSIWIKLPGATGPTLQPSATEIGYRLRCVISSSTNDSSTSNIDKDEENEIGDSNPIICETADVVTASIPILNGSRQALARGAQFGGLLGQGKAEGRTFRIKIVLSSLSTPNHIDRRKSFGEIGSLSHHSISSHSTIAAVTIYQVAGMTAEPIHPESEPILCRAATVWDYNQIKSIALIFHSTDLAPSASMVAALCSTDNEEDDNNESHDLAHNCLYFRLQAPNRLTRESMLLTLGIANFTGKPSELNDRSILFLHDHINECSGSASSSLGDDSIASQSSSVTGPSSANHENIQCQNTSCNGNSTVDEIQNDLDDELQALRSKLMRKDKVISELQRQVTHCDETQRQTEERLRSVQNELNESQKELFGLRKSLADTNGELDKAHGEIQRIKSEHDSQYEAFEIDIQSYKDRILALERENRTLHNDKDVLKAAVESRDFKLCKMEEIQASLDEARVKLTQRNNIQLELDEASKHYNESQKEVERLRLSNAAYIDERNIALNRIESLEETLKEETSKYASYQSKLEMEQMKVQKLKAERNSYKQKGDSLVKEMSRLCRDGRTIRDIEKILADDTTRREEVNVLREQKRKALEQVEHFRTAYEQSLSMQKLSGIDLDTGKILERNAELERLLSELTEYLNAKEMQLDTLKQVNDALQSEIRTLARASMSKNDI
jgi:hypothetical protein